jgi:hypothetical protein
MNMKTIIQSIAVFLFLGSLGMDAYAQQQGDTLVEEKVIVDKKKVKVITKKAPIRSDTTVVEKVVVNGKDTIVTREIIVEEEVEAEEAAEAMEEEIEQAIEKALDAIDEALEEVGENASTRQKVERIMEKMEIEIEEEIEEEEEEDVRVETSWNIFELGLNNFIDQDGKLGAPSSLPEMEINNLGSINFQWRIFNQRVYMAQKHLSFEYGLGIDFNNFRFAKHIDLHTDSTEFGYTVNDERNYIKNKLVTQYASAPLMLNLHLGENRDFVFGAGAEFGYRIGSHQKIKWQDRRKEKEKIRDDYNLNDFRLSYKVQIGYKGLKLYGRYAPTSVFESGPDLGVVSVGLRIGGF